MASAASLAVTYEPPGRAPLPGQLVASHTALVRKIAWHVHGRARGTVEIEDLIQIGMVALVEAATAFVQRGEAAFSTYATLRCKGAMIDHLRKSATMARSAMQMNRRIREAREALTRETGRTPGDDAVAARLDMSPAAFRTAVDSAAGSRQESLDEVYSDHSMWFAADQADAFDDAARDELREALAGNIGRLPEREAMVLQLYFVEEMNLDEIGAVLDVGAARVCQIKKAALDKLRTALSDWSADHGSGR